MLTERQFLIIRTLRSDKNLVTAGVLAPKIGCSVKTLRNEIAEIRNYLSHKELGGIVTRPHYGIKLEMSEEQWQELLSLHDAENNNNQEGILNDVQFAVFQLLSYKAVRIQDLEQKRFLSRGNAEKCLDVAVEWLDRHGVEVNRVRGVGTQIEKNEFRRRLALWELWNWQNQNKIHLYMEQDACGFEHTICSMNCFFGGFHVDPLIQLIEEFESDCGIRLSYQSFLSLLFLTSVSLTAVRKKNPPPQNYDNYEKLCSPLSSFLADKYIEMLVDTFKIRLVESERNYFLFLILSCEIEDFANQAQERQYCCNPIICNIVDELIIDVESILQSKVLNVTSLFNQIYRSLSAMLVWHTAGLHMAYSNKIGAKEKHERIFFATCSINEICQRELGFCLNGAEVDFLTLLFVQALKQEQNPIKTGIICNYGTGVSLYLREELERIIPGLKVVSTFSLRDERAILNSECDFLISVVPFKMKQCKKPVVFVHSALFKSDYDKILDIVRTLREQKNRAANTKEIQKKKQVGKQLFSPELVFFEYEGTDKKLLLEFLCKELSVKGCVEPNYYESVWEREKQSSTMIGKKISLPHGKPELVHDSQIAVVLSDTPIKWNVYEQANIVFLCAFKSIDLNKETIRAFYSVLIDINNEKQIQEMISWKDPERVSDFLNQRIMLREAEI